MALDLIVISLAIAVDPIPLTAFVVVLASRNGLRKGAGYLCGWLLSLGVVVATTLLLTGNDPPRPKAAGALAALAAKLLIGTVLVAFGVRQWRRLGRPRPPRKAPKWRASVDSMSTLYAAGLAPVVQPWALIGAGAATIADARISNVQSAVVLVLFALLASSSVIGLEVYAKLRPRNADALLKRVLAWLERNTDYLVVAALLTAGLYLMASSIYHLVS